MPKYIWTLDKTQTFDTYLGASWADEYNSSGTLTYSDKSVLGMVGVVSSGYNAAAQVKTGTWREEVRVEMDVIINFHSQYMGMALWAYGGVSSVFTILNYTAVSGLTCPAAIYKSPYAPQFAYSPSASGVATHTSAIVGGVHTVAFEVINTGTGKLFKFFLDGTECASWNDDGFAPSIKFRGGLFLRNFGIDILEYREYFREEALEALEVQTVVAGIGGSPDAPVSAIVKAFNVDTDLLTQTKTSDPVTGIAVFDGLSSGKSYYFFASLPDNSYNPEALGPIAVS